MLNVQVQITGLDESKANLTKLGQKLYQQKSALDSIGSELENYFGNIAFASQGGVFGDKWTALTSAYSRLKIKRYAGRGPLVKTGTMKKSFYHKATQNSLEVGNTAPYFPYHQSTEPRTIMPRRPMIEVNDAVTDIISAIIQKDIQQKITAAGF